MFTKRIAQFNECHKGLGMPIYRVNYWDRLREQQIFSLERRRERYMILYMYKIIIGLCPNPRGLNSATEDPTPGSGTPATPHSTLRAFNSLFANYLCYFLLFLPIIYAIFCLCDHYTLNWRLLIGCWSWDVKRHFGLDSQVG